MTAASRLAKNHGLLLHVDGARIFNAAICVQTGVKDLLTGVDSISFCLSKGLSAPVGSMVCGSSDFIQRARRVRKVLGGGMRQAGVLAVAGILALTQMVDRLEEDHGHARIFAEGIAELNGIIINPDDIRTNIVFFDIDPIKILPAEAFVRQLEEKGVRIIQLGPCRLRAVTHRMINRSDIDEALTAIKKVIESRSRRCPPEPFNFFGSRRSFMRSSPMTTRKIYIRLNSCMTYFKMVCLLIPSILDALSRLPRERFMASLTSRTVN